MPVDQRADDAVSLTFDRSRSSERLELLGRPEVRLALAVDRPHALVAARLCDVAPDGASLLVSWGLLNLTHRDRDEVARPARARPALRRDGAAQRRRPAVPRRAPPPRGAVSPTYWPHAWPSPEPVTLSVFCDGASRLTLPVRAADAGGDGERPAFEPPEWSGPVDGVPIETAATRRRTHSRDEDARTSRIEDVETFRMRLPGSGTDYARDSHDTWSIADGDPLSATFTCERTITLDREGWHTRIETSRDDDRGR